MAKMTETHWYLIEDEIGSRVIEQRVGKGDPVISHAYFPGLLGLSGDEWLSLVEKLKRRPEARRVKVPRYNYLDGKLRWLNKDDPPPRPKQVVEEPIDEAGQIYMF